MAHDEFAPKRAVKSQVRLKIAVNGPSGSGKTEGALSLATRMLHEQGFITPEQLEGKILLVDTENESASLFADRYVFDTIPLSAPYSPERYIMAINRAVSGGYGILILDSISHEWAGEGGIMHQIDALKMKGGNEFTLWAKVTPGHEKFIEAIKQAPIDIIVTMRTKAQYILEANNKGKQTPRKVGMAPIQRDGVEYEFSLVFDLDETRAKTSKNRTTLFKEETQLDLRDPNVAKLIIGWRNSGAEYIVPIPVSLPVARPSPSAPPAGCISTAQVQELWVAMRAADKTAEEVAQHFEVASPRQIAIGRFAEALAWVKLPRTHPKTFHPGEEDCRAAAKVMGASEADLMFELATCRGDWIRTREVFQTRAMDAASRADEDIALAEEQAERDAMAAAG